LPFAIRNGLGLKWGATLRVARGEIKIDQARSETREYTPSVSTGEHDLVRRGDLRLIANEPAWKIDNMIRRDDFPVAALIIGQRKFWLREDIEAYLRGDEMPERTENELGDLYVSASQAAEILGLHAHRVSASDVKDLPEPVFKGKNTHLWRRSDIEAFKEVRKRQGLHGGRRRFPKSR
ncbi:MAG TPA: hypothetical protein VJ838_12755, partial [Gaiellaceae bacterium]|nr:hypothetical protein [Gaiellaceae bacterium]